MGIKSRLFSQKCPPSLEDFKALCSQQLQKDYYPLCSDVISNVPVYNARDVDVFDENVSNQLANEFHDILNASSGVFVIKNMYQDPALLQRVNSVFATIINEEKSFAKGDHFGKGGVNDRIWNAFTKHGLRDPQSFYEYYSNPWMRLVCLSWLGPMYRITSQVNIVKPGGAPQSAHRDYHLGFMDASTCQRFPTTAHITSQYLTLQGAVAHSAMPLESGPTRLLPFSQRFEAGYMAYRLPEFDAYFSDNYISLPLELGDGLFFNPALFHAAGRNDTTSFHRSANLIQVSSCFGKPMEAIDTISLAQSSWKVLTKEYQDHGFSPAVTAFISALAEGYAFPTDLDARPPQPNGMAPESEQDIVTKALLDGLTAEEVATKLRSLYPS